MIPDRATIESLIRLLATAEGLDPDILVRQCEAESTFNPNAINPKTKATGLFQLMPATAAWLHVNAYRWHENVFGGVKYDGMLFRQFAGDYEKMLAAYDWGPGNLDSAIHTPANWQDRLPQETKDYIAKILQK